MNNNFANNGISLQESITNYIIENSTEYKHVLESALEEINNHNPSDTIKITDIRAYLQGLSNKALTLDMQNIPTEFDKLIADNFWDLV
jgi:hypothetical protein